MPIACEEAFIKAFVEAGNHGGRLNDFSVGWDPIYGMEVLAWREMPVASRKLLYINGVAHRTVVLWKKFPIPEWVEAALLALNDPNRNIRISSPDDPDPPVRTP